MKQKSGSFNLTGSMVLIFWLVFSLSACSTGETTSESIPPTLPESTTAPVTVPTSTTAAQETSAGPQVTNTTVAPTETSPAPSATVPPATLPGDPRQAIISAMNAMREAGSYRVHVTSKSGETSTEWNAEVILPDRFHIVMDIGEYIIIGNKTYMKQGDQWAEFPVDIGSMVFPLLISTEKEAEASISDVQLVGQDTVNGEATTVYQYRSSGTLQGTEVTSMVKLWVRNSDDLPVKQEINGEVAGVESTTVQDIEYDPTISIEPPI